MENEHLPSTLPVHLYDLVYVNVNVNMNVNMNMNRLKATVDH